MNMFFDFFLYLCGAGWHELFYHRAHLANYVWYI